MEKKKLRPSEEKAQILSQCPECFSLEMVSGKNSQSIRRRPSMVKLPGIKEKLCPSCVEKLTI